MAGVGAALSPDQRHRLIPSNVVSGIIIVGQINMEHMPNKETGQGPVEHIKTKLKGERKHRRKRLYRENKVS